MDLAARLRQVQRTLRSRLERRDTLVDLVRAVNTTLEPQKIAELLVERAAGWVPAPSWAVVSSDPSGPLSVLADRGPMSDMEAAVMEGAARVMKSGAEFAAADLRMELRVGNAAAGAVVAFPLTCRGRLVGVLMGLDRLPSAREPRLSPASVRAL